MTISEIPTLDKALAVARRLPLRDRARLIARLAEELAEEPPTERPPLPIITEGTWSDDLPLRREDLYDDSGRC